MRAVTTQSIPAAGDAPRPPERMSWRRCKSLVASDLYRHEGVINARGFWRNFLITPGFRYSVMLRLTQFARAERRARFRLRQFMMFTHYRYSVRYAISISPQTHVGSGLYIGHFG